MAALAFALCAPALAAPNQDDDIPKAHDPRLVVERFAAAPDIVHPVNLTCDRKGRLLVIESHTHFRPKDYQGPKHDRIRMFEDTKGTGKADRITTFFEGTTATMDIALHPDGSIYIATRNEIIRLEDTTGAGKADKQQRIVFLDTKGNYPHNGLSGLCFDSKGNLYFGMGENLGAAYKLIGSDGTAISDEGEGGNVFWCTADGKKLRRVATGFWNPFGICTDIFGRVFAVDNDPDAMPPCRMLHVVEGGDYGYQFRYGRSGRHLFQAWHGQLPGTLPSMTDTGEAPCKILSYESTGLPREYLGDLLVAAWADHRIERYVVSDRGASVKAERKSFIQGGANFRPVGIAVAPDGSLFVSDWVLRDYHLHGKGAIWHVRMRNPEKVEKPTDPQQALLSRDRSVREAAARQLAETQDGKEYLRKQLKHEDVRVRAAALTALADVSDPAAPLLERSVDDPSTALRAQAVRAMAANRAVPGAFRDPKMPPSVMLEAIPSLRDGTEFGGKKLLGYLAEADPFLRNAAVRELGQSPTFLKGLNEAEVKKLNARQRAHLLLAFRAANRTDETARVMPWFLADPDPEVRVLAVKWIADEKLAAFRAQVVEALKDPQLSVRLYFAYATALARIDKQDVNEERMADFFAGRLTEPNVSPAVRVAALRLIPSGHKKLTFDVLAGLLKHEDGGVQFETVRFLADHPDAKRVPTLLEVAKNPRFAESTRAHALLGIADRAPEQIEALLAFANGDRPVLRDEALRTLTGTKLSDAQRRQVEAVGKQHPAAADLVARVLGQPFAKDRPKGEDTAAWLKRLEGPADAAAGQRVFFHPRLAGCARCHRVDGRGADIGPDLSNIGRTERRHILESLLQPNLTVAPHYQVWAIETKDGKTHTGMLMRTHLDEYTYVDAKGGLFKLNTRDIVESVPVQGSIMPGKLEELLTDQELRDLLAYLSARR
jgi:putative membrane-bound dehydrogenase-like protein